MGEVGPGFLHAGEDAVSVVEELFAGRREANLAAAAVDQADLEFVFQ